MLGHGARDIVGLYGELAFGVVCSFWIWHEIEVRFFKKKQ